MSHQVPFSHWTTSNSNLDWLECKLVWNHRSSFVDAIACSKPVSWSAMHQMLDHSSQAITVSDIYVWSWSENVVVFVWVARIGSIHTCSLILRPSFCSQNSQILCTRLVTAWGTGHSQSMWRTLSCKEACVTVEERLATVWDGPPRVCPWHLEGDCVPQDQNIAVWIVIFQLSASTNRHHFDWWDTDSHSFCSTCFSVTTSEWQSNSIHAYVPS